MRERGTELTSFETCAFWERKDFMFEKNAGKIVLLLWRQTVTVILQQTHRSIEELKYYNLFE